MQDADKAEQTDSLIEKLYQLEHKQSSVQLVPRANVSAAAVPYILRNPTFFAQIITTSTMSAAVEQTPQPYILRLQQSLVSCSKIYSWKTWEFQAILQAKKNKVMRRQTTFAFHHGSHPWSRNRFLIWMAIVDALSFELPKVIAKFAGVSERCRGIVETIIAHFLTKCSPRDMISVFSEVYTPRNAPYASEEIDVVREKLAKFLPASIYYWPERAWSSCLILKCMRTLKLERTNI
ncbi:uncharacterized protein [Spinacia oleracea]|uniref:Uncharacterized protein n=1 Tax=Spinacia oleracea TaxID=3562 RepID=A0A9R0KCX0_SPIOL|nr:uncharacterized protein LOC110804896 [Spinacia oleracea]